MSSLQSTQKLFANEESFSSESIKVKEVKKVKKIKTSTKTVKTTSAATFDQREEMMLMQTSTSVVENGSSSIASKNQSFSESKTQELKQIKDDAKKPEPKKIKEEPKALEAKEIKEQSKTKEETKVEENIKVLDSTENSEMTTEKPSIKKKTDSTLKKKTKRTKKTESGKENISVKSSFSKFDALQKKENSSPNNSDNAPRSQSLTNGNHLNLEKNCKSCGKVVFQMEQIKAERSIWHKNCFRCQECNKQLNVDTYQSHEGILYCKPHFKTLFAPKAVEDNEPVRPRKHEMIIRESQPMELPPDVVRASDKPDLGLDELHQLNIKSCFQMFENHSDNRKQATTLDRSASGVKRSASILSKLARFQKKGMNIGENDELDGVTYEESSSSEGEAEEEDDDNEDDEDIELVRARRAQKEPSMSFGNMNDMKTRFESGHELTKEERREERKQEIQNIRSRLFMGKQARIKEMYQQAVADSEQICVASSKKCDIDIDSVKSRSLKERFEKGEFTNEEDNEKNGVNEDDEMNVFEQGICKKSRSMFMELDATIAKSGTLSNINQMNYAPKADTKRIIQQLNNEDVVKSNSVVEDVKIETADITSKFKFFETYKPNEKERKQFRITPPRDGVVKLPTPERDLYRDPNVARADEHTDDSAEKSHTASKMLSIFRQMEESTEPRRYDMKPLKRFTPPPGDNPRYYNQDSESEYSDDEDYDDEEEEEEEEEVIEERNADYIKASDKCKDEFLTAALSAERAKILREKFEKWEKNEIQREQNNSSINLYCAENEDESQVESAKSLRQRFESMHQITDQQPKEQQSRIKVNRFV